MREREKGRENVHLAGASPVFVQLYNLVNEINRINENRQNVCTNINSTDGMACICMYQTKNHTK